MTKRDVIAPCPALSELFAEEPQPSVVEHAAHCLRCQALLGSDDTRVAVEPISHVERHEPLDEEISAGDVVLVNAPASDEYLVAVVTVVSDETMQVVPISAEIDQASEWDLLLPATILGYAAMAETWNYGTVLPEQIEERLIALPADTYAKVAQLRRSVRTEVSDDVSAAVGPAIVGDEDPRLVFHDAESERAHAYWEPTLALAGSANLAQLVMHRRSELALAVEELESLSVSEPGWLERLERDELPVKRYLPAGVLATLMLRLQIGASRRLRSIVAATLAAQTTQAEPPVGSALARRRVGSAQSEQDDAIYIDEVMRELARLERG